MRRWLIVLALALAAGFAFAHGGRCGGGCGHKGGGQKGAGGRQWQQAQQKQVVRGNAQAPNTILQGIKHLKDLGKLLQQAANLLGSADPKLDKLLRKIAHLLANIRNQFALPQVGVSFAVVKLEPVKTAGSFSVTTALLKSLIQARCISLPSYFTNKSAAS